MKYALICSTIGSLMKEPNFNCSLLDEALYGMKVELLSQINDWYLVRTHYRYEGYVNASSLLMEESKISNWEGMSKAIVTHSYVDVLSLPKVQGACLLSLTRGALVAVLGPMEENGFVPVLLVDGRCGYIKRKFLGPFINAIFHDDFLHFHIDSPYHQRIQAFVKGELQLSEEVFRERVVQTAISYLGTQYRWGGKTSLGIDCSGLCAMAYLLNGLVIYRDAKIVTGFPVHEIAYEDKKPGDLLFFPGHVAMYIGDDRYVHSTSKDGSDGVVINSLNPSHEDYREDLVRLLHGTGSVF